MLSKKQLNQEKEYEFPYHHLLKRSSPRGLEYFSYVDAVINILKRNHCNVIADIGCGDGKSTQELSRHFKKVIGFDYSEKAIAFAKSFSPNIEFKVIDFTRPKIPSISCDALACIEVIEHIQPNFLPAFVENIAKILKKQGIAIITTPTPNLRLVGKHHQHFNESKLDMLFQKKFHKKATIYQLNKYAHLIFFLLRGALTNRYYDINIPLFNKLIFIFYKTFVEKARNSTGQRIIYICEKK